MRQIIFKRILPAFLAFMMIAGTLSPIIGVKAAAPTETTVSKVDYAPWSGGKWQIIVKLATPMENVTTDDYDNLTGLTYSVNGGTPQTLNVQIGGKANLVNFMPDATVLPQDAPVGTTVTINAGTALSGDESKGFTFTAPVTLARKSTDTSGEGWVLQKAGPTETSVTEVGDVGWTTGNKWNIYLQLSTALEGSAGEDWTKLYGLTYSINGGASQDLSFQMGGAANLVCLAPDGTLVPENVAEGTELTIHAGQAVASNGSKGLKFVKDVTLVKTASDWEVQEEGPTETTVSKVDYAPWSGGKWQLIVKLATPMENVTTDDYDNLTGLTYSVNGGTPQSLNIQIGGAANLVNFMPDATVLPQDAPVGTTVTINAGTALSGDESKGFTFTAPVTLARKSTDTTGGGWVLQKAGPTETKVLGIGVNA